MDTRIKFYQSIITLTSVHAPFWRRILENIVASSVYRFVRHLVLELVQVRIVIVGVDGGEFGSFSENCGVLAGLFCSGDQRL